MSSKIIHKYDSAGRSNKENESNNGKQSEMTRPSYFTHSNFDWVKRESINQQRKQRITQVWLTFIKIFKSIFNKKFICDINLCCF